MSSSSYWSYQSFEDAMKKFVPLIKPDWIKHMKVVPVGYSNWSDTISVIVELDIDESAVEDILGTGYLGQELTARISDWLRSYVYNYLDTKIAITDFRRSTSLVY